MVEVGGYLGSSLAETYNGLRVRDCGNVTGGQGGRLDQVSARPARIAGLPGWSDQRGYSQAVGQISRR